MTEDGREPALNPAGPIRWEFMAAHAYEHTRADRRPGQLRALWIALVANAALLVVEVVAGVAFGSLALFADAGHLVADVAGLAVAIAGLHLAVRPATLLHTFGFERAEVLAAQASGLLMVGAAIWVSLEAAGRLLHPGPVDGGGLVAVASVGLVVNLGSSFMVHRASGGSLNMRGAFLHLATDAIGSLGTVAAGILILGWGLFRADAVMALVIAALVIWSAWGLLKDATHVLMEGAPKGIDPEEIDQAITEQEAVQGVHHLHLWNLASDVPALSAHVVLSGEPSMREAQRIGERLKAMLAERYGVEHVTLELECCEPAPKATP